MEALCLVRCEECVVAITTSDVEGTRTLQLIRDQVSKSCQKDG
jgi:hypothetical protein